VSKRGIYAVRISGLGEGDHEFSFELDRQFFASFEHSEIEEGNVKAVILLERKSGVMTLNFAIKGKVEVICDRCLEPFFTEIYTSQKLFIKTGDSTEELDEVVIMINKDDHEIEVGHFMYEFVILALPYKRIHPDNEQGHSTCNAEMLKRLETHKIKQEHDVQTDPRWDALKGIFEKNN